MPDNPERNIEKQLRASAERRRMEAGAPFELHEATRRMLQAEVARQYGKPQDRPDTARSWWLVFWPRLAIAGPLVVLLIMGVFWVSSPPGAKDQSRLASAKEKTSPEESKLIAPPAAGSSSVTVRPTVEDKAPQPLVTLAMAPLSELKKDQPVEPAAANVATSSPVGIAGVSQPLEIASADAATVSPARMDQGPAQFRGGGGGFGGGGGGQRGSFRGPPVAPSQASAESTRNPSRDSSDASSLGVNAESQTIPREFAAAPTQAPAFARGAQATQASLENEVPNSLFFRNTVQSPNGDGLARAGGGGRGGRAAARALVAPAPVVLNSFRFEQAGNELRIVDEDGSVYVGQIQLPGDDALRAKELASPQGQLESRARFTNAGSQAPANPQAIPVYFNVTGVNRSLSQQIVFTGQLQQTVSLLATNSQTSAVTLSNTPTLRAQQTSTAFRQNQLAPASNSPPQQRIIGRARLADSRELPVDAFQTQR